MEVPGSLGNIYFATRNRIVQRVTYHLHLVKDHLEIVLENDHQDEEDVSTSTVSILSERP